MATVFFRGSPPNGSWWLRIYNPKKKQLDRFSLKTGDRARAELISQKVELAFKLAKPELQVLEIPAEIALALEIREESKPSPPHIIVLDSPRVPKARLKMTDAVSLYLGHIKSENNMHHVDGKISMLRQLLGPELLPYKRTPLGKIAAKGFFTGQYVDELSAEIVLKFLNAKE